MCPEPWGRECQTSEGGRGALTTQPGAGLRLRAAAAPAAPPAGLALAPGLPAHMPRHAATGRGAGRGTPPPSAGTRSGRRAGRVRARRPAAVPGGALRGQAALRPLPSALRPLPSAAAVSLPSAVLPRTRPDAAPARRPALRPSGPAPRAVRSRASAADRCARPGAADAPARVPGPRSHFTSRPGPAARRSRLAAARRLHSLRGERGRETERAGEEEGGRVGRRRREGRRVPSSSLQPGPSWHQQLETSGGKGRAKGLSRGGAWGWRGRKKHVGSAHSHGPGVRVPTEALSSLGQDPRSCPPNSLHPSDK